MANSYAGLMLFVIRLSFLLRCCFYSFSFRHNNHTTLSRISSNVHTIPKLFIINPHHYRRSYSLRVRTNTVLFKHFWTSRCWAFEEEIGPCSGLWESDHISNRFSLAQDGH